MKRSPLVPAADTPAALRPAPLLAVSDHLERRPALWWGSRAASLLLHAAFVAWVAHTGVVVIDYTRRLGYGYQFGQAVLLASPLFEIGQRGELRGRERQIPLAALVPQRKLYAPDLRRLASVAQAAGARLGDQNSSEDRPAYSDSTVSALSLPTAGGGGALPSGSLPERVSGGAATPFDLVPPSNTRQRRANPHRATRLRAGDAAVPGGGAPEGLRLPPSPSRVGIEAELDADPLAAPDMEEWLRVLVSRLRRASFDLIPDRRDAGAPGISVLAVEVDRAGRVVRRSLAASSGNPGLDRLALALLDHLPLWQPLPPAHPEDRAALTLRVRYFPRR